MAHLRAKQAAGDNRKKLAWKRALVYRLYERRYTRDEVIALFRFIDWVIRLPQGLEEKLRAEIYQYQEQKKMPYLSSWERMSREEGRQEGFVEGLEQGLEQGERSVILRQLNHRIGEIDAETLSQIEQLSLTQLEKIGKALLDFTESQDLHRWLKQSARRKPRARRNSTKKM